MGLLVLFFNLAVECFDVLAWPLFALGYPIWASIQAIETNSISEIRKLITYWVSVSLILIFEELLKLPEWIPFWHFLKLILAGCLVAPYFDGSVYVYNRIIHPCLSADPQVVINMFIKLKELFLEKYNLLVVIERDVIKEHEPETLENLIAFKPCVEAHEVAKNDISAVEIKEKKQTASAKIGKIQPDLAPAVDIVRAALEIKDLTASMASCRDGFSDTPPCRSMSKEWTCPICQVTTTSEEVFISHLQGQRHEAASKKLQAKNQILQSQNSSSSAEIVAPKEMATAAEARRDVPNKQSKSIQEWNCPICQVTVTNETAFICHLQGRRHDAASWKLKAMNQLLQSRNPCAAMEMGTPKEAATATAEGGEIPDHFLTKSIQKEWTCPICQLTSTSETVFISHLQGRQHEVACEKLKAKNQMLQNENSAGIVKMGASQEMATAMESGRDLPCKTPKNIQEWTCPICQVTVTTETNYIAHLQERRHEAASKMLKAKNQILRGENSPDSVKTVEPKEMLEADVAIGYLPNKASKNNIQEWTCPICQVTAKTETIFISHLQGSQHEAASDKLKAENWMLQSKNLVDLMETGAHDEMATVSEAGSSLHNEPASKDIQNEWSSTVCQVISTNDPYPITHLPIKQNEERNRLKADNQTSRSKVFPPPLETYVPSENIEITTISTVANQVIPDKPHSKSAQMECTCGTCQITTSSDAELISQLQGQGHNACRKLKDKKTSEFSSISLAKKCNSHEEELQKYTSSEELLPKNTKDEVMKQRRHENLKNGFIELRDSVWRCTICNIKFNNDGHMDSHLNGRKHLARKQVSEALG